MEENKKSKTWQGVLIGLLIGISLTIAFTKGVYDGCFSKDDKTVKTDKEDKADKQYEQAESLDVLSDVVQNNLEKFMKVANYYGGAQSEYFKEKRISNKDIPNTLAFSIISGSGLMKDGTTEEELEEYIKQYFGEGYEYKHEEISGKLCTAFYYNKEDKKYYAVKESACGGTAGPHRIIYTVTNASKTDDKLVLTIRVLFPGKYNDYDNYGYQKYYSDANLTNHITELEYIDEWSDVHSAYAKESVNNYKKGGTYIFTMKKYKGDVYSFESCRPSNSNEK